MKRIFKLSEEINGTEIKLDQNTTEVDKKPVGSQNPNEVVTPNDAIKPEADETKVQKAEVDPSIVKDENGDASKKVSDQDPEMVVDPALKGAVKAVTENKKMKEADNGPTDAQCDATAQKMFNMKFDDLSSEQQDEVYEKLESGSMKEGEEDNKELTAGNAGDIETKPVGSQDPKAVDDPALKGTVKAQTESKIKEDEVVIAKSPEADVIDHSPVLPAAVINPDAANSEVLQAPRVTTVIGDNSPIMDPTAPSVSLANTEQPIPEFVVYENAPRAVLSKDKDSYTIIYEAVTGSIKTIKRSEIKESFKIKEEDSEEKKDDENKEDKKEGEDKDMKESMKNKVYTVLKETRVGDIILEKNDRFIIVEAEGDAKDNAEDAEKAKAAGMTPEEWEKSEADKRHDEKKEESKKIKEASMKDEIAALLKKGMSNADIIRKYKDDGMSEEEAKYWIEQFYPEASKKQESTKRTTYIVKEEVKIGNIILEKNDRFQIIESDEQKPDPDAEKYQDPVDLKLDMPDVKEEAKKDKNGKFPFEKGYIKEEDDTEEKKDDPEKKVEEDELTPDQKKLDVDKDGKIDGEDLAKIRADKKEESFITVNGKKYRAI